MLQGGFVFVSGRWLVELAIWIILMQSGIKVIWRWASVLLRSRLFLLHLLLACGIAEAQPTAWGIHQAFPFWRSVKSSFWPLRPGVPEVLCSVLSGFFWMCKIPPGEVWPPEQGFLCLSDLDSIILCCPGTDIWSIFSGCSHLFQLTYFLILEVELVYFAEAPLVT